MLTNLIDFVYLCCMNSKLKRVLIDALVAVLSAVVTFLGTVTFTSCGSTWNVDTSVIAESTVEQPPSP